MAERDHADAIAFESETTQTPRPAALIARALRRRCPVCADKAISRHVAHVARCCPNCGLDLERQTGSFIGGVGINTIISFTGLLAVLVGGFVATGGDASVTKILLPALGVAVFVPLIFYARSRLVWVAIELAFYPLAPAETKSVKL